MRSMKKIFLMLFALCVAAWSLKAQETVYLDQGKCGDYLLYTIDTNYKLAFWSADLGIGHSRWESPAGVSCEMPNFLAPGEEAEVGADWTEHAPWLQWADKIRSLDLNNLDNIGSYAFCNMVNLRYLIVPMEINWFGQAPFLGCDNLRTLEMRRATPPESPENALYITETGDAVEIIIVPQDEDDAILDAYREATPWMYCNILTSDGEVGSLHWHVGESDSINQAIRLSIENWNGETIGQIPDRDPENPYPWDSDLLGDKIEDLVINDNISYIGKEAFSSLVRLKSVTFHGNNHPLDSMHLEAFPPRAELWKFSLGDPNDGPKTPPAIIGDLSNLEGVYRVWRDSTVLYVPDWIENDVKVIEAYKNHPFWGTVFNRITDRTVEVTEENNTIILKWLPLENTQAYLLNIRIDGCEDENCDTTIVIPAVGPRGLIDWMALTPVVEPGGIAARRAPQEEGGGGLVLTITLNEESGNAHNEEVEASISGMEVGTDYVFFREVVQNGVVNYDLSKDGLFKVQQSTAVEKVNSDCLEQGGQKLLIEGRLYILRDGQLFNAQGQLSR